MRLNLINGWTLSLMPDLHEPFYSVAAWPTVDYGVVPSKDVRWFVFKHGGTEERILDLAEFADIAEFVANASPP